MTYSSGVISVFRGADHKQDCDANGVITVVNFINAPDWATTWRGKQNNMLNASYVIEENYVHFIVEKLLACRASVLHGALSHDI